MNATRILRRSLLPGDLLLDCTGQPFLRVERVDQARARGYVVISGQPQGRNREPRTSGHGNDAVLIQERA